MWIQLFYWCCLHLLLWQSIGTLIVLGQQTNDFEIKTLTGEPDYRSVNLTWAIDEPTNEKDINKHKTFNVFYCELQTWGPHRCKSKTLEDNEIDTEKTHKQYSMIIDNLRMATKYSFHVKPRSIKSGETRTISGRADLGENELGPNGVFQGQTIVIPTKGFSAHATKCLPDASEIEVETGPNFGGRIVAEGSQDCAIQGDYESEQNSYVMRIDHEKCGSQVDRETLTVKTFITVQENLGIFTHSTRRFVVVCTYQPDTLTIRASFSVPGRGAAAVSSDWEESDRNGRQRKFRMVGKSSLVLKEDYDASDSNVAAESMSSLDDASETVDMPKKINLDKSYSMKSEENVESNLISKSDDIRDGKYARLMQQSDQASKKPSSYSFNSDYTGLIIAVSLSVILLGALLYIVQKESYKRRIIRS